MKAFSCEEALETSFRWKVISCLIWNSLLLYCICYVCPVLVCREMETPYLAEVVKIGLLLGLILLVKVWTFTSSSYADFPDCCSTTEEVQKLFTSTSSFHAVLVVYLALFPPAFRTMAVVLGVFLPGDTDQWVTTLALSLALLNGLCFLCNHESLDEWSIFERYESSSRLIYDLFVVGFVLLVVDLLFLRMMHNFLIKPPKLDIENALGEQLAIVGLKQMSPMNVQFACFQDLLRVSTQSSNRFLSVFNPRTQQWTILLERGLDCLRTVSMRIRNRTSAKVEHEGPRTARSANVVDQWSFALYSVFNENFDVKFRRELYQVAMMANIASATLTNFMLRAVPMECAHYVNRENGVGRVLESQWQAYHEAQSYQKEDREIDLLWFIYEIRDNMKKLFAKFKDERPGISRETEDRLTEMMSADGK